MIEVDEIALYKWGSHWSRFKNSLHLEWDWSKYYSNPFFDISYCSISKEYICKETAVSLRITKRTISDQNTTVKAFQDFCKCIKD